MNSSHMRALRSVSTAALLAVPLLACSTAVLAPAEPASADQGAAAERNAMRLYIVQLADAPLASYSGGVAGLAATRPAGGSPDLGSPASHAYLDYLGAQQAKAVGAMSAALGRRVTPTFTYYYAVNGLAVNLTPAEAAQVAKLSGVVAVRPDAAYKPVQP